MIVRKGTPSTRYRDFLGHDIIYSLVSVGIVKVGNIKLSKDELIEALAQTEKSEQNE